MTGTVRFLPVFVIVGAMIPGDASALDAFVVEARGIDFVAGQVLDAAKPIPLQIGQRLTLVTADGRTVRLQGPSNQPPVHDTATPSGPDVVNALKGLVGARAKDVSSAGTVRSGTTMVSQADPWLVEVRHGGDRCLSEGAARTVLWRGEAGSAARLDITPADRSWSGSAAWPADADKIALPPSLQLQNGESYVFSLDDVPATLTFHVIPARVAAAPAQVAWMIEKGCTAQAEALIQTLR